MEEDTEVQLDGKTYVWDGRSWTDPKTYMEPPASIVDQLNAKFRPHEVETTRSVGRSPRAPRGRSSPPARFVPRSLISPPAPPPKPLERITLFEGVNAFLSVDAPANVYLDGQCFPSIALAFDAAKQLHDRLRPGMQREWDEEKRVPLMRRLLRSKFANPALRQALLATAEKHLSHQAEDADRFWHAPGGEGENQLGILLMNLRAQLNKSYQFLRDEEIVEHLREYLPDNPVIPDDALTKEAAWDRIVELHELYKDELAPDLLPTLQGRRHALLNSTTGSVDNPSIT